MTRSLRIWLISVFLLEGCLGCAVLSKSQIEAIHRFSTVCDSFSTYPGQVLTGLSDLRTERGVYYSASLSSPELRLEELDNLRSAVLTDEKSAKKADLSVNILQQYMRALRSLSHENRTGDLFREIRSLGKNLDSLVYEYNDIVSEPLPAGIGKAAGELLASGAKLWMRHRQAKKVKYFVSEGDTLVALLTQTILEGMNSPALSAFIDSEARGQRADYLSYLRQRTHVPASEDRLFLARLDRLGEVKQLKTKVLTATRSVRKAHRALYQSVQSGKKGEDFYSTLLTLENEMIAIKASILKLHSL